MVIYKVTNIIDGKFYVGQDSKNDPKYYGSGLLIKKAIKKYGKENFKKEILEYCKNFDELNEKEKYWIEKLNATNRNIAYNITIGGFGSGDVFRNHPDREKILKKISENHANVEGENNPMFGKTHTKEVVENIKKKNREWIEKNGGHLPKHIVEKFSQQRKGRGNSRFINKVVQQFNLEGVLIKEWKDFIDLKENSTFNVKCISRVCRGINKTHDNYIWKWKQ
jgi:group I intron endonuclease